MAKLKKSELRHLCDRISDRLDDAYEQLRILNTSYNALMRGDGEAYWDGAVAESFYKTARGNLSNDIQAYVEAYEAWNKLRKRYEGVKKADQSEATWS